MVFLAACSAPETEPRPEPNCRVPIDPAVSVGVSVGSSGVRTGGSVVFDASGNNGLLDENGECVLIESKSKFRVGIGF
ncbi:MAG: hypothetical protein AAF826_03810 [Pseudomonadota bacterium]